MATASDETTTSAIRCLAIDTVQKANSGHPGAPMGMAPVANILFSEVLKFDPNQPLWHDRDRFVLSNGHASALLYSMLHLSGFAVSMDELKRFRQLHSITPGHPERGVTPGVEVTTGPLGQGLGNAVGLAMAEAHLAARFNQPGCTVVDHYTFVFCGDGCLMEGVGQEALSLAGHLGLEKLVVVYDDNFISIDGDTNMAYTEDKAKKYEALGFHVLHVDHGDDDYSAIRAAFAEAKKPKGKPTFIMLRTTIGFGAKLQGTAKVHGSPLGDEDIAAVKRKWGRDPTLTFNVEPEVYARFTAQAQRGVSRRMAWDEQIKKFRTEHGADAAVYDAMWTSSHDVAWFEKLPRNDGKAIATRKASENALGTVFNQYPSVVGGSADLTGSNLTRPASANLTDFQSTSRAGRYIRFGVREHAMAAVMNGIDAHGGLIAFGGTFLNFIGYALGAVRLAAMSHHGVIYVATHDSIGLGEDGPTHQPVELVASLRATPNLLVLRPADQTETSAAWASAMQHRHGPSVLCLSRQAVKPLVNASFEGALKGAYTVIEAASPQLVLLSTGTEVSLCVDVAAALADLRVRVVSMPCDALFNAQPAAYKASILPAGVPVLSVEVYAALGWERYSHYHLGMTGFGASAPDQELYAYFGFTVENIVAKSRALLKHFETHPVPSKTPIEL